MPTPRLVRQHLSADALIALLRSRFASLHDPRSGEPTIALVDVLMSAFALFTLKAPSLLAFDQRRHEGNQGAERLAPAHHVPIIAWQPHFHGRSGQGRGARVQRFQAVS